MVRDFARHWRVLLVYVAAGVAMYSAALGAFFMSDDFEFLAVVASAKSWTVIFEPLVGRYVRPFVVLMYYACYKLFGLAAWPYHVATLLPHLAAAFLVYLVGLQLFGDAERPAAPAASSSRPRFLAFLAGLLFLVFSGHSEAVAWPAGVADPIVAVFLLVSFLLYLRATEPETSAWLVVLSYLSMLGAVLTKEIWVSYPGILFAHAGLLGRREPQALRRAAILVTMTGVTVVAYLVMRQTVFGSVMGAYSGLGTSFGTSFWITEVRAFVLRSVVPGGLWTVRFGRLDLLAWPALAGLLAWRVRGREARVILFTVAAAVLLLMPVLPLTISLTSMESERLIYVATVFSCLFIVASASAILRAPAAVAAVCGVLMAWHGVVLVQNTLRVRAAGVMARGIIDSFADGVRRYDPQNRYRLFLLNLPDNLDGAYVYRRGFYSAVQLFAPDVSGSTERTTGIATNSFLRLGDSTTAAQTGPERFTLDVRPGRLIQPDIPSLAWYQIVSQTPWSYEARFSDADPPSLVFHTSAGRVAYVGSTGSKPMSAR